MYIAHQYMTLVKEEIVDHHHHKTVVVVDAVAMVDPKSLGHHNMALVVVAILDSLFHILDAKRCDDKVEEEDL